MLVNLCDLEEMYVKKTAVLFLLMALLTMMFSFAVAEGELTDATEYTFNLANEEQAFVADTRFNETVVVYGEQAQIYFENCEFNGDIILRAEEGTRVFLFGCTMNGKCIFQNTTKEASFVGTAFPKFGSDTTFEVVANECFGCAVALHTDMEVIFNGVTYGPQDTGYYWTEEDPDAGYRPYMGEDLSAYFVAQWWECGTKMATVGGEYYLEY